MTTCGSEKDRILIVDDTPANIEVLGAMLSDHYAVSVAVNGPSALEISKSDRPPALILLDIMMPEMDGYEVARHLKSHHKTQRIPIIFVTAKVDDSDEAYGFEVGAVDYIRKPVTPAVTLARIRSHLELKHHRDRLSRMVEEKDCRINHSIVQLQEEKDKVTRMTGDLKDRQAAAHKHQAYFRELFMNSPHAIVLVGTHGRIINVNDSASKLLGYSGREIMDRERSDFFISEERKKAQNDLIQRALAGQTVSMESRCVHRRGFQIPVSSLAYPVKVNGRVQGVFVFYENISQRKMFEEQLKHQAYHDALTGIPNRLLFSERLDYALSKQGTCPDDYFSVMLIDLDRFKSVNDTMGHQAGDELLKAVSARIRDCLRTNDTLARLGGDEFAVLLPQTHDQKTVTRIASRIRDAVEAPFSIQNRDIHISASIGIVMDTSPYEDAGQLIRDADLAMYHAKDSGKAQFKVFSPGMHERLMATVTIEQELRKAIEKEELVLFFQPIVCTRDQHIKGFEALVRWAHPTQGLVLPDKFIPIAEDTGLIIPMGQWITEQACTVMALWKDRFAIDLTMNINISVKQFLEADFSEKIMAAVSRNGLNPWDIKLEFTETLLMEHREWAVEKLNALKEAGFVLAIDDFGTGYSSLSYLQRFPIDQIKIDRSFIGSLTENEESFEIVKSILLLGKSLGLSSVAEGVETLDQLTALSRLECGFAQGYYFSKPLSGDEAEQFMEHSMGSRLEILS